MGKYELTCLKCGNVVPDNYSSIHGIHNSLLRTEYAQVKFRTLRLPGIWKFYDWLPVEKISKYSSAPVTYRSRDLSRELGLGNLFISFSGYFPEMGCQMMTCTFKELEAPPTVQRALEKGVKRLIVASAGNTARAFAFAAKFTSVDIYLVVPELGKDSLWLPEECSRNVHLIMLAGCFDYSDAIQFSEHLSTLPGFMSEGGARNIARRDGMGTVLLDAVNKIRKIPRHYFQAVGSGTGAIAVWESALRLKKDGKFNTVLPCLHLAQNAPFIPMVKAWQAGRRKIVPSHDMPSAARCVRQISAGVLSNRNPPYSIMGGVYDALKSTRGFMYSVTNKEAVEAGKLFESLEGIDIVPAAKVAVAALLKSVAKGKVSRDEIILLNITGGGEKRLKDEHHAVTIKPEIYVKDLRMPSEKVLMS